MIFFRLKTASKILKIKPYINYYTDYNILKFRNSSMSYAKVTNF